MAINKSETPPGEQRPKRRRRTPAQARREILDAGAALLAEVPSTQVTVIAIMARTTLSRKSFYVYFRDRADMLANLVAPLRTDADATLERWRAAAGSAQAGRDALRSAAQLYHEHGTILRALAQASDNDAEAARIWQQTIDPVIAVAASAIADATRSGQSHGLDPEPTARALVTMNIHCFLEQLAGKPHADVNATVATLTTIWERTIYLRNPLHLSAATV